MPRCLYGIDTLNDWSSLSLSGTVGLCTQDHFKFTCDASTFPDEHHTGRVSYFKWGVTLVRLAWKPEWCPLGCRTVVITVQYVFSTSLHNYRTSSHQFRKIISMLGVGVSDRCHKNLTLAGLQSPHLVLYCPLRAHHEPLHTLIQDGVLVSIPSSTRFLLSVVSSKCHGWDIPNKMMHGAWGVYKSAQYLRYVMLRIAVSHGVSLYPTQWHSLLSTTISAVLYRPPRWPTKRTPHHRNMHGDADPNQHCSHPHQFSPLEEASLYPERLCNCLRLCLRSRHFSKHSQ